MAFAALFEGKAAAEHLSVLKDALVILARQSREQAGTIRYEFFQPQDDPLTILLFAVWEDEADWKAHVASDVHNRYAQSLPAGAWAVRPVMTRLQALEG